jgi:hypothetical protein
MIQLRRLTAVLLVLTLSASLPAQLFEKPKEKDKFYIAPLAWLAKMTKSDINIGDSVGIGPVLGENIDFVDDFGTDGGPDTFFGVRGMLSGFQGKWVLRGGYQTLNFSGGTNLTRDFRFAGYSMPTGSPVDTSLNFDFWEAGLQWNIVNADEFQLGILAEPKFMNLRVRVNGYGQEGTSGPVVPFKEIEEEFVIMPLIGLHLNFRPFELLGFRGELKGFSIPNADSIGLGVDGKLRAVDAEGAVSLYFSDAISLSGGYRLFKFSFDSDQGGVRSYESAFEFQGWFAAVEARF